MAFTAAIRDADAIYFGTTQADAVYVGDTLLFQGTSFSPTDIANAVGIYLPEGLPASGSIATWTDSSAAGHDLTQAIGSKQPVVVSDMANGNRGARFDGIDDVMTTGGFTWAQPAVMCLAFKYRDTEDGRAFSGWADPSPYLRRGDGTTNGLFANAGSFYSVTMTDAEALTVVTLIFNGATTIYRENGVQINSADAGTNGMGGLFLGAGLAEQEPAGIDVLGVACYSAIPAAGELDSLEGFMADLAGDA